MTRRIDYYRIGREALASLGSLETYLRSSTLDRALLELVKVLASKINGCTFCVTGHTTAARARGESEERIAALALWRSSPLFTDSERAVFAWTDAVTRIESGAMGDHLYEQLRASYSEKEVIDLTFVINAINCWNRLHIAFDTQIKAH